MGVCAIVVSYRIAVFVSSLTLFPPSYKRRSFDRQFFDASPSGSSSSSKYPFNSYYRSRRCQTLYLASDILKAGAQPKHRKIVAIQLKPKQHPRYDLTNFRIEYRLMEADVKSLRCTWYDTTTCYGPETLPVADLKPAQEWTTFRLQTPIEWDGESNILLQYSYNGPLNTQYYRGQGERNCIVA